VPKVRWGVNDPENFSYSARGCTRETSTYRCLHRQNPIHKGSEVDGGGIGIIAKGTKEAMRKNSTQSEKKQHVN